MGEAYYTSSSCEYNSLDCDLTGKPGVAVVRDFERFGKCLTSIQSCSLLLVALDDVDGSFINIRDLLALSTAAFKVNQKEYLTRSAVVVDQHVIQCRQPIPSYIFRLG